MTRLPFLLYVAAGTALAGPVTALTGKGSPAWAAAGVAVAGLFAAAAVMVLARLKARRPEGPGTEARAAADLAKGFAGLMMARMIGYLALLAAVAALNPSALLSVGAGVVTGTIVFQALEVAYLRKLS
ncbi:MAG TPA: hypothetical protein VJV23_14380 [Candidatus Polarisedimenticolia bacterium]|nr:hypothetical protein [Candidatus Polarisedimenticolia bacterium]